MQFTSGVDNEFFFHLDSEYIIRTSMYDSSECSLEIYDQNNKVVQDITLKFPKISYGNSKFIVSKTGEYCCFFCTTTTNYGSWDLLNDRPLNDLFAVIFKITKGTYTSNVDNYGDIEKAELENNEDYIITSEIKINDNAGQDIIQLR